MSIFCAARWEKFRSFFTPSLDNRPYINVFIYKEVTTDLKLLETFDTHPERRLRCMIQPQKGIDGAFFEKNATFYNVFAATRVILESEFCSTSMEPLRFSTFLE